MRFTQSRETRHVNFNINIIYVHIIKKGRRTESDEEEEEETAEEEAEGEVEGRHLRNCYLGH